MAANMENRVTDADDSVKNRQLLAYRRHLRQVVAAAVAVLKQVESELGTSSNDLEIWLTDQIRK